MDTLQYGMRRLSYFMMILLEVYTIVVFTKITSLNYMDTIRLEISPRINTVVYDLSLIMCM